MLNSLLHFNTIKEISNLIKSKQLSPVEITTSLLQRIDDIDSNLMSYATVTADSALDDARKAEKEIYSGNYKGPLHGIPLAVKDLCYTKGVPTMGGSRVHSKFIPDFDATVISKLAQSGAVMLGKLNLTEGAMRGYHPDFMIPKNPWNKDVWVGTSSSGSGVATAAGLCYGSLGSDTGGSIRFPSSACGVVGLKPTYGRVSRYGILPLAETLDHVGPLARSSFDAGIILQAISGEDVNDQTSLSDPPPDMKDVEGSIKNIKIGWNESYATNNVRPEIVRALNGVIEVMENLGAEIIEVDLPDIDPYLEHWAIICSSEAFMAHSSNYPLHANEYGDFFREWLEKGSNVTPEEYVKATIGRNSCNEIFRKALVDVDVLMCPTMTDVPFKVTEQSLYGDASENNPPISFRRYTIPFDYNGAPTITLPCGFTSDGLPLSFQFVGKHLSESSLCQIGNSYELATDWHKIHPNM